MSEMLLSAEFSETQFYNVISYHEQKKTDSGACLYQQAAA